MKCTPEQEDKARRIVSKLLGYLAIVFCVVMIGFLFWFNWIITMIIFSALFVVLGIATVIEWLHGNIDLCNKDE